MTAPKITVAAHRRLSLDELADGATVPPSLAWETCSKVVLDPAALHKDTIIDEFGFLVRYAFGRY